MSVRVGKKNLSLGSPIDHETCRVTTNIDHESQIFLSHPHTNNGLFFLLTTKCLEKKHEKHFQKILNTLKCDMVMSF